MGIRILVIEDENEIADFLVRGLREEGFSLQRAADGEEGWHYLKSEDWDVVLLDWWLPGTDGLTLLRRFRQENQTTPVLFLTAKDAVSDRVKGLDNGADDYLCKPFAFAELLARVRVMSRRQGRMATTVLNHQDVQVDIATHRAERAGQRLELTAKENALLVFFLRHPGEVLTRTRIYEQVWDERYDGLSNTLEVHVMELRRKLESHGPRLIHTLRNRGYFFARSQGDRLTLTSRLTRFFLGTLAVVFVGFSATLYFAAKVYLHRQSEERLESALNTLVAAVEIGPDFVEWEPMERHLAFAASLGNQLEWLVSDDQGRVVDRSAGPSGGGDLLEETSNHLRIKQQATKRLTWQGERWQVDQRWIQPAPHVKLPTQAALLVPDNNERKFPSLTITAGVPLEPVKATLRILGTALVGLSLVVWLMALFAGRALCRRALAPVTRMAETAREMDATDLEQRLPFTSSGDEIEDLSQSFNSLLDRLQESFERQQRFTGEASHQLRTPLSVILGQIEVALRRDRSADDYRQILTTVHQKAEHLRKIVESLLFLARANAETGVGDRERLDLKDWLPRHVQSWADHPRFADIVVDDGAIDPAFIEIQPTLLGELLNILLDNAAKYSEPGSPIVIRMKLVEQFAELSVHDRGSGITDNDQLRLFTPFFRSADVRRRGIEGVGLGLSIAKRLAETFGGTVTVTSRMAHGSCFSLRLPLLGQNTDELAGGVSNDP